MSSIVSLRPSSRNHWNEAFWMSMRLGRSRTCSRRENDVRARGEATLVVKKDSLPWGRTRSGEFGRESVQNGRTAAQPARVPDLTPFSQAEACGGSRYA